MRDRRYPGFVVARFLLVLCGTVTLGQQAAAQVDETLFDSNGVHIYYEDQGQGEPVVLIHGGAQDSTLWNTLGITAALRGAGYRVITFDMRGHGRSGKPHDPAQYGLEVSSDVSRMLDHLEIETAHVLGFSLGAIIANDLRSVQPGRVLTMTMVGAGAFAADSVFVVRASEFADGLARGTVGPIMRALTPPGQPQPTREQVDERDRTVGAGNDMQALAAIQRALGRIEPVANLRANKVPALALIGEIDPNKKDVDRMAAEMANLEVVVIRGADHFATMSDPMLPGVFLNFLAKHPARTTGTCSGLADLKIENTNLLSATVVPARDDLPEYCRVLGYVRPAINFEIRLPTTTWNGKFYMRGCGGYCGEVRSESTSFNEGLRRHYAVSTTDGGHWGTSNGDSRWAYRNPVARFDFAQRAVTETARVTKAIIRSYYEADANKSYFAGCSAGGRQGIMEAWRYAEDFDGVISGAPGFSTGGSLGFTDVAWKIKANTGPDGKSVLQRSKLAMIANAVYEACAGHDGLIADPRQCTFTPESLRCEGAEGSACLTDNEIEVLGKWYGGPRSSQGRQLTYGIPLGSEPYWTTWVMGENDDEWQARMAALRDHLRNYGFDDDPGRDYDVLTFDFDKDPMRLKKALDRDLVADGTDLSAFRDHGGKLLVYHGWADPLDSPEESVRWYDALTEEMGGAQATETFARLFMVPGMDHCGASAPGPDRTSFDPLPALEQWVEYGIAPASIVMTRTDANGGTQWTQPVCAYPTVARHQGTGDIKDAAHWACVEP